jgi:hypothetical protein
MPAVGEGLPERAPVASDGRDDSDAGHGHRVMP